MTLPRLPVALHSRAMIALASAFREKRLADFRTIVHFEINLC